MAPMAAATQESYETSTEVGLRLKCEVVMGREQQISTLVQEEVLSLQSHL